MPDQEASAWFAPRWGFFVRVAGPARAFRGFADVGRGSTLAEDAEPSFQTRIA
jgi:hypothetical protein